jgi:hypothetical protein
MPKFSSKNGLYVLGNGHSKDPTEWQAGCEPVMTNGHYLTLMAHSRDSVVAF